MTAIAKGELFRDPNTLVPMDHVAGKTSAVVAIDGVLAVSGEVAASNRERYQLEYVVLLDKSSRFVAMGPIEDDKWRVEVPEASIGNDNNALEFLAYAVTNVNNLCYPLVRGENVTKVYAEFVRSRLPADSCDVPTLLPALREVVSSAIKVQYTATSVHDAIRTPSRYQTIRLGQGLKSAGREERMRILSTVEFRDKSVLDVGANMGENSRVARALGARLVDGYEYDPYFVEIGRVVNALTGMTRVSLFQGDITRSALLEGMRYDIVLGLSVWVYMKDNIARFPQIASVLVFETHTLDHGMDFYYKLLSPHYKHAACLGLTDVGLDPNLSRAVIVFSNDQALLDQAASRHFVKVQSYFSNEFINSHAGLSEGEAWVLAEKCFEANKGLSTFEGDAFKFGKYRYFEMLLAGLHQFRREGKVSRDNLFRKFYVYAISSELIDSELKHLLTDEKWLLRKIGNKFEDLIQVISGHPDRVPPIRLVRAPDGKLPFKSESGEAFMCREVDGHHRFFAFQLMGLPRIHCILG